MRKKIGAALLVAVVFLVAGAPLAVADDVKFTIKDGRLSNLSGLTVASDAVFGVSQNDDVLRVYRINTGSGAINRSSVEDVSVKACSAIGNAGGNLYVADLAGSKAQVKVMKFKVPAAGDDPQASDVAISTLKYPQGDKEGQAVLVSPSGKVFVVAGGDIYAAPDSLSAGDVALTKVGKAPDGVTGGSFLPDGKAVLRSNTEVFVLDVNGWKVVSKAKIDGAGAGSAIAATADSVYLAGSGARQAVYAKAISSFAAAQAPATESAQPQPPTSASPAPAPAASAGAVTSSPVSVPTPGGRNNTGTLLAVLAAALVAGGMGIIVFVKK